MLDFLEEKKKKNEVLQLDLLNPNLVIMDETDSDLMSTLLKVLLKL